MSKSSRNVGEPVEYSYVKDNIPLYAVLYESEMPLLQHRKIGIGMTWFRKKKAAMGPVGPYFSIGANMNVIKSQYSGTARVLKNYSQDRSTQDLGNITNEFRYFTGVMEFGNNGMITKDIFYNLGLSFGANMRLGANALQGYDDYDMEEALERADRNSLQFRDAVSIKIGIGALLF
jgi:hypothetical protein